MATGLGVFFECVLSWHDGGNHGGCHENALGAGGDSDGHFPYGNAAPDYDCHHNQLRYLLTLPIACIPNQRSRAAPPDP